MAFRALVSRVLRIFVTTGDGSKYLADDGTYKTVAGGGGGGGLTQDDVTVSDAFGGF
jgi:hypothetical protein